MELTVDQALQKGIEAHKAGKAQEADRYYTAILKANPKHPDANHNMGVLAVGVSKVEEALPFFKTALETNSSITQYWLSYINALIKLDRIADAKAALNEAKSKGAKGDEFEKIEIKLNTFSVEIKNKTTDDAQNKSNILDKLKLDQALKIAKKKINEGKNEEAKKIYQDILVKFPENKKVKDGIKKLASKTSTNTENIVEPSQEQLQSLVTLYKKGQYQDVHSEALQLLKQFPNSFNLYNISGAANHSLGRLDEAIEAYIKAISIKPDYAEAYNHLGIARKEQGKLEEAVDAYNKAITIKPDFAEAFYNLGIIFKEQGRLKKAIEKYTKALAIKPNYAGAHNNLGNALHAQGKLEEAIDAYNRAITVKPDNAEAFNNLGNALQKQGKLEEAILVLNKALSIKPDNAEAYNNLGNALQEQGKLEEAIEAYNKALSIKPDYAEVIINASSLKNQLADTALLTKEFEKKLETHHLGTIEMPKFHIHQAIRAFLLNDQKLVRQHLNSYEGCIPSSITELETKDQVFCFAYNGFLNKLIETPLVNEPAFVDHQPVFHLGESHCLSYAHNKIKIHGIDHSVDPRITFGGKAYHFSTEKGNAFKAITKANFQSLPYASKVFLSFGEIDCRPNEGIISAASKLNRTIEDLVSDTTRGYVGWFAEQNHNKNHSLFFLNVPAPIYNDKYSKEVNGKVTSTIILFNRLLHKTAVEHDFNIIDVYKFTVGKDGFSNGSFHVDAHHLSSHAIPEIEKQIGTFL